MRRVRTLFVVFLFLLLLALYAHSNKVARVGASSHESDIERVTIRFKKLTPGIFRKLALGDYYASREELRLKDALVIKVPKGSVDKVVSAFSKNLWVEYAEKDHEAYALDTPNDPFLNDQWGLVKIQAQEGWNVTHGTNSVDIAIVDTGINYYHPDLANKISATVNCIYSSCPNFQTSDPDGHGTHVAGIVSASTNNSLGVAGISWEGRLMSVKVLDDTGRGYYSWIANGIIWAADNGAEVINLSLGGSYSSFILRDSVKYAWDKGVVVVAAAGNAGSSSPFYPAYYSWSIAVGATDTEDNKASFSNYGESWVDVAAPGTSILSTYGSGYGYLSGTSMAAPHVSGLAALVKSLHPGWGNLQVREKVEQTTDSVSGTGTQWKWGRINVCKALDCGAQGQMPSNTPTPTIPEPSNTPTPLPSPSATPSPTPTLIPTPTSTPTPTPTPTPSSLPWWCAYVPWHYTCQ